MHFAISQMEQSAIFVATNSAHSRLAPDFVEYKINVRIKLSSIFHTGQYDNDHHQGNKRKNNSRNPTVHMEVKGAWVGYIICPQP
jgi:hypothetical protein